MKRIFHHLNVCVILLFFQILTSCSYTNEVASSSHLQKRKYTKGYFINFLAKHTVVKEVDAENILEESTLPVSKEEFTHPSDSLVEVKDNIEDKTITTKAKSELILKNKINIHPKPLLSIVDEQRKIDRHVSNNIILPENRSQQEGGVSNLAIYSLLCLIFGGLCFIFPLFFSFTPMFAAVLGLLSCFAAMILGIIANVQIKRSHKDSHSEEGKIRGRAMAIIGFILGIIGTLVAALAILLIQSGY